jgi:hypothetical protein
MDYMKGLRMIWLIIGVISAVVYSMYDYGKYAHKDLLEKMGYIKELRNE